MVTRQEILELAQAHAALEEPTETAIWIRQTEREAWLVEVIPAMPHDEHTERPVEFNPGLTFRHPLNLILGNWEDITAALHRDPGLAAAVAAGDILVGDESGMKLMKIAQERVRPHGNAQATS